MTKTLDMMTASEIAKVSAKAEDAASANCRALIAAGFGNVTGGDIRKMDHALAAEYIRVTDRCEEINAEIAARKRYHGNMNRIIRKAW